MDSRMRSPAAAALALAAAVLAPSLHSAFGCAPGA